MAWKQGLRLLKSSSAVAPAVAAAAYVMCGSVATHDHPHGTPHQPQTANQTSVTTNFMKAISCIVSEDQIETHHEILEHYGNDQYSFHSGPAPDVVIFPSSTEQVSALMKACQRFSVPVTSRSGGTSLEGHATTPFKGLVLDFSKMDRVLAVRPGDLDCTVQAGVGWQDLNAALAPHGLFFPVDPGPGAKIGGMCGTGASGTNACRHLPMKANVLSLTLVLADGTIVKTASRARKSVSGYDLTSLFVGSEGTLGVVTEATLKLTHVPKTTKIAVVAFHDIESACNAVADLMASGAASAIGAVELLDAPMMHVVNEQRGFNYKVTPHLFFKLAGTDAGVADAAAALQRLAAHRGGGRLSLSVDKETAEKLWEARKVALWSAQAQHPDKKVCTTDVCVPLSSLPRLMKEFEDFRDACAKEPRTPHLPVYAVAHAGDGNAHHFILFDPSNPAEVAQAKRLNGHLVHTAIALGGTCTGEHGVGVGKLGYLEEELGPGAVHVMRLIKSALDPKGILNPGKKVPGGTNVAGKGPEPEGQDQTTAGQDSGKAAGDGLSMSPGAVVGTVLGAVMGTVFAAVIGSMILSSVNPQQSGQAKAPAPAPAQQQPAVDDWRAPGAGQAESQRAGQEQDPAAVWSGLGGGTDCEARK